MDYREGETIEVERENNSLRFKLAASERLKRARSIVAKSIPKNVSLADELIAERRREAENE